MLQVHYRHFSENTLDQRSKVMVVWRQYQAAHTSSELWVVNRSAALPFPMTSDTHTKRNYPLFDIRFATSTSSINCQADLEENRAIRSRYIIIQDFAVTQSLHTNTSRIVIVNAGKCWRNGMKKKKKVIVIQAPFHSRAIVKYGLGCGTSQSICRHCLMTSNDGASCHQQELKDLWHCHFVYAERLGHRSW